MVPGFYCLLLLETITRIPNNQSLTRTPRTPNPTNRENAAATYDSIWHIFSDDGGMPESGLKLVIDQGREALKIDRPVAITVVAEYGFLRDAQRELGIKTR